MDYNIYKDKFNSVVKCVVGSKKDKNLSRDKDWKLTGVVEKC